jgi:hypothetical protein
MSHPPTMISDDALGVENKTSTATAILPSSQTPLSTSPLELQCRALFQPTAWRDLTSVVRRPRHWQVASSTHLNKTVKIPLRFRHPTTTGSNLLTSSQKDLESPLPSLPKGWVYEVEDIAIKTEAEVVSPNNYRLTNAPLTRLKRKRQLDDQHTDPHCQHRRASNTTEVPHLSPSVSRRTAAKLQPVTSAVTDLQGPPSERTQMEKIRDLKSLARQYARDRGSCDDTRISYLEFVESEAEADLTLARMIAG